MVTFFAVSGSVARRSWVTWSDALGLSAFTVIGCHIALSVGAAPAVAIFMGMLTATGGGLIRDIITGTKPMITEGQLYATAALIGAGCYALLSAVWGVELVAEAIAFSACFLVRAAAIVFDVRMGPPGEFIRIGTGNRPGGDDGDASG